MHKRTISVHKSGSFLPKSLRKSKKMYYFAPRKWQSATKIQDSTFIINILKY